MQNIVEIRDLKKSYKGGFEALKGVDLNIQEGEILALLGPNGAGKTTLFRMLTGEQQPDGGEVKLGSTVDLAYVDQSRDDLDGGKTVWEEVSEGLDIIKVGSFEMPSRSYVGRFNFKGSDQQKHVGELSGGERNRLHLAKLLRKGGNVLLLDEPTNDLDVETLRALEEALLTYAGSAMVISHDRWFLDRIATHILDFEGEEGVEFFEGNFTEYEAYKKKKYGEESVQPKRIKYKKLS